MNHQSSTLERQLPFSIMPDSPPKKAPLFKVQNNASSFSKLYRNIIKKFGGHDGYVSNKKNQPAQGLSSSSPLLFVKKRATRMEHRIDLKVSWSTMESPKGCLFYPILKGFLKTLVTTPYKGPFHHQPPAWDHDGSWLLGIHGASWNPHQFAWLVVWFTTQGGYFFDSISLY